MLKKNHVHGGDIYSHPGDVIDFSANINPLGLPQRVRQALVEHMDAYTCYPDPHCRELRTALAAHEGVDARHIVCGNGAADLIYRIVLSLKPRKGLVIAPTFSEYEEAMQLCGCSVTHCLFDEESGFIPDRTLLEKISDGLDILFLCNPNNPTGVALDRGLLIEIAAACAARGTLLVVDECFNGFLENSVEHSLVPLIESLPHVIVLKAFTKIYAMAGIRLGYALCGDSWMAGWIGETLQPWSVSVVASKCGVAALADRKYLEETREHIQAGRSFLTRKLGAMGCRIYGSEANFIFFRSKDPLLVEKLKEQRILIRSCDNFAGLGEGYYRVAVKKEMENRRLVECMGKALVG